MISPQDLLSHFYSELGDGLVLASSLGAEDQVLTDMVLKSHKSARIIVLDTGRLPQETYDVLDQTNKKYGVSLEVYFPDAKAVEDMVTKRGPNLFYESIENRKLCCHIRKVEPLARALKDASGWITGMRKDQSITRSSVEAVEWDGSHQIVKLNPLVDWSESQVWDYIQANDIPYNKLHDQGYPSIGCAPCTRAVKDGEDPRAGRWWWENPEDKECGIHIEGGKVVRTKVNGDKDSVFF